MFVGIVLAFIILYVAICVALPVYLYYSMIPTVVATHRWLRSMPELTRYSVALLIAIVGAMVLVLFNLGSSHLDRFFIFSRMFFGGPAYYWAHWLGGGDLKGITLLKYAALEYYLYAVLLLAARPSRPQEVRFIWIALGIFHAFACFLAIGETFPW